MAASFQDLDSLVAKADYPHGAISITFDDGYRNQYDYAFPLMEERGITATFYVITSLIRDYTTEEQYFMSLAELHTLQDYGCEIASHSNTHPWFTYLEEWQIREECEISKEILQGNGFLAENFAYPSGVRDNYTDSIVAEYYRSGRSAYEYPYTIQFPMSEWLLPAVEGEPSTPDILYYLEEVVDAVYSTNEWAIIFFHNVIPGANNEEYTISSEDFESFLDYIIYRDVATITVSQGLDLTSPPAAPPSVAISPTSVRNYVGQSQTFSSSVLEGNPPFFYQWYLNGTAVSGANSSSWIFTPATAGHFRVYLNVTDSLNYEAQSNIVSDIQVYSVYLSLNVEPKKPTYEKQQQVTFSVTIFNQLNPALDTSLILTVTGPNGYHLCHPFPISVKANSAQEHSLSWVVPEAPGTYIAEVQLAPSSLTAYDTVWLKIS